MQPRLLDGTPPGTQGTCTPNGWTTGEYYPTLDYAKNNVVILSLVPHTTHKMQPMDVAIYGPLKTYFEREVNAFQKTHTGHIINQYDVARRLSPVFLKCAVVINAVHGFERHGIWLVNKYAFGDEDHEPAAVITDTSNMNIRTEGTKSSEPERVIPEFFAETSSTPSPSLLEEFIPSSSVRPFRRPFIYPLVEVIPSQNRATPSVLQAPGAPIIYYFKTPEKIRSNVECSPELEPGCSQIASAVDPDIATNAQKSDTMLLEIEEDNQRNTNRDKLRSPKPGCSTSHYSPFVLRPIPNPAKSITTRKRNLQKTEILKSTPIKEGQKEKFEKNKTKKVTIRLDDKSANVPIKTVPKKTKTGKKNQKTAKKLNR
ncbi:unnamed protein product [Euphydryas editha]|uniref:DDE-1 domain-containing protein n=1 Tax=Euphydryas editha TaxID=104508 RepID=A0AAU9TUU1_EUPED|nr:unnamed protein product [Euphydryas editha]